MDGIVLKVEWWPKERFRGRVNKILLQSSDDGMMRVSEFIPIPDDCIVCDVCNASIENDDEFPVCIVGSKALCRSCQSRYHISEGDTEYFESAGYACGLEDPKPGVNFGGRKR